MSKALLQQPGNGSIAFPEKIRPTPLMSSRKRFFDLFGNPNKKANALTKLERHIQDGSSLEQYVTEFQVLVTETGLMEEDYLICHLVLGLNERLKGQDGHEW